ncbi:MAG: hypothetical protein GKR90_15090 [Pseudomonadales bacterium]|nr:hypothetical protein [Pseudomonadales bacterium]
MSKFVQACLDAAQAQTPYPSFVEQISDPTVDAAYTEQQEFVKAQNRDITGYKAALTAPPAQQAMGIDSPVFGVLFDDGRASPGAQIAVPGGGVLETELGFTLAQDITTPVSPDSVLEKMDNCKIMIEVARPNLPGKPNGLDLIATNSASFRFIEGGSFNPLATEVDEIETSLEFSGERVFNGRSGDVMSGQRAALAWLINSLLTVGYELTAGNILMTGSVGGIAPTKPGDYRGDFGSLGDIPFSIS